MSDMTPEEHYEKFGEPGLHHGDDLCECAPDMTPERLIEELKAAGFEENFKDQETVCLQKLSTGDHSQFFTELFVVLNPSEHTGRFDYARAEPFLKAHRLDKALQEIKNYKEECSNPHRKFTDPVPLLPGRILDKVEEILIGKGTL